MKKLILLSLLAFSASVLSAQIPITNGYFRFESPSNGGIRIGKMGDAGNLNVPVGGLTATINLDFSGYRDVSINQIGARISALRFNKHIANSALLQHSALAFYTNDRGWDAGEADLIERMRITPAGNIGIGTTAPNERLEVNGTIRAKAVKIEATGWADYVFADNYTLPSLTEVKAHIQENKHLPNIPSEAEVKENGVDLGEMQVKLLQKIEELTLYVIQQDERAMEQQKEIELLKSKLLEKE